MLDRTSSRVGGELLGSHGVVAQLGLQALAPRGFMASSVPPGSMDGAAPSPREWISGEGQWVWD